MTGFRPLYLTLLLIAAVAIAGPVWAVFVYKAPPATFTQTIPSPHLLPRIEAMAEDACRCTRARHGAEGPNPCWKAFDTVVEPYAPIEYATACGITGTEGMCFLDGKDKEVCFTIDRSPQGECNDDERRIITSIWSKVRDEGGTREDIDRAVEADKLARAAFERGDKIHVPQGVSAGLCGT